MATNEKPAAHRCLRGLEERKVFRYQSNYLATADDEGAWLQAKDL